MNMANIHADDTDEALPMEEVDLELDEPRYIPLAFVMDVEETPADIASLNYERLERIRRARSRSPPLFYNEDSTEAVLHPNGHFLRNNTLFHGLIDERSNETSSSPAPELNLEEKPTIDPVLQKDNDSENEDGDSCSICFDVWTNSGSHRLTSLKCGHLFGHSCIKRWLTGEQKDKYCPTCKTKASTRDLRFIYAKKLTALDTFERDQLAEQLDKSTSENARLQLECRVQTLNNQVLTKKIEEYKQRIELLTSHVRRDVHTKHESVNGFKNIYLEKTIEISTEATCRVLSYNSSLRQLAASQKSQNSMFPGYGVTVVDMVTFKTLQFVYLGSKTIRDIAFHPINTEILLSASMDKSAKIYDMQQRKVVRTINTEGSLWACCWDVNNSNYFYLGSQLGSVEMYDSRNISNSLNNFKLGDMSPVIALAGVKADAGTPFCQGGFLCCKLNSCWAIEKRSSNHVIHMLPFEGPFTSLSYDNGSGQVLVSSRPSQKYSKIRHVVSVFDKYDDGTIIPNVIHTFNGGNVQKLMSKTNQVVLEDDTLVAAHSEDSRGINIWSVKNGEKIKCLASPETVMDICPVKVNNDKFITALSETKLRIYRIVD